MMLKPITSVMASSLFVCACATSIRGYEGPRLSQDSIASVRTASPGTRLLRMELDNPITGEPLQRSSLTPLERSKWLDIASGTVCIAARARPIECPGLFEALAGSPHGASCRDAGPWAEHQICFTAQAGSRYEIDVDAQGNDTCWSGLEITGFRISESGSTNDVATFPITDYCVPD